MHCDARIAGVMLIVAGMVTAGAYVALDAPRGDPAEQSADASKSASPKPVLPSSHPKLAPAYPPMTESSSAAAAQGHSKQAPVEAQRAFNHYRIGNHSVRAIYADGHVMWVGTSGGMVRYDTQSREFKTYDATTGLRSSGVFHVGKLRGRIAVGTHGGGLSLYEPQSQTWEHYSIPEGLGDAFVYDALEDASGDIWIATGSGVNRVRGGALTERAKWQLYTVESTGGGLPADRVFALAQGRDGSIWCATAAGIARFRQGKWTNWPVATGAPTGRTKGKPAAPDAVAAETASPSPHVDVAAAEGLSSPGRFEVLGVDGMGRVWAGTRGAGLARFDGGEWKRYTTADGLPSNRISALHVDSTGRLWIGTDKGLAVLSNGTFRVMTTTDGLLAESVHSVRVAADGGIWVGAFGGVAHIRAPSSN